VVAESVIAKRVIKRYFFILTVILYKDI